jgi:hypothetical protein
MGYRFSPTFVNNLLAKYDPRGRRLTLDNFIVSCVQECRTSFYQCSGSGIRDGKNSDSGSGINIPDPQHCFLHSWNILLLLFQLKALLRVDIN